jgi:hypothetical protein
VLGAMFIGTSVMSHVQYLLKNSFEAIELAQSEQNQYWVK